MKEAVAYSNNDVAFLAWRYDQRIDNCLGFAIFRSDVRTGVRSALPAWVGFKNQSNKKWKPKDTTVWPIQKFNWRDLTATRGRSYRYEIVPMLGKPGSLTEDFNNRLETCQVDLTPGDGNVTAYFNRGILSTQHLSHQIPHYISGVPDYRVLTGRIDQPGDPLRNSLAGQMIEALSSILIRARTEGGECYCALYELNDPELIEMMIGAPFVHIVLSNTGTDDGTNVAARQSLHESGVDLTDRMLKAGHIGHNKFVVYVDKDGNPRSVLSGSTNWTYTGICAQSNNAVIIESAGLAKVYLDYWNRLKEEGDSQTADFRARNSEEIDAVTVDGSRASVWFSPNTKQQSKPAKKPKEPRDFAKVSGAIMNAQEAVLFLVFQPGSPSIIDRVADAQNNNPKLFVRGAATDPKAVENYRVALYHLSAVKADTVVAASALNDQFAFWQKELKKASPGAHAVIHDKVVVIDPFSDNCVVITGSHNLGYRASYSNDENLLIVHGHRRMAEMYAVHIMDIYDHYRWRYWVERNKGDKKTFFGLETNDSWQDKYFLSDGAARNSLAVWFEQVR